ncbi:MAG: DUF7139 domain-containing protein [Halobacteriota archaeon]
MQSLDEAYDRRVAGSRPENRLYLGFGLLVAGVALVFAGGVVGVSSTVGELLGLSISWERWGLGARIAGVGLPMAFAGVFTVVPMPVRERAVAAAGVAVTLFGVLLFDYAYPSMWAGDELDLTGLVFLVYTTGSVGMFWTLFRSVLNIEISLPRNTLSLRYEEKRRPAQTATTSAETKTTTSTVAGGVGYAVDTDARDAEVMDDGDGSGDADDRPEAPTGSGDPYCGNCVFYDYVQERDGASVPYCEKHEETLRDLEACDEHEMRASFRR